MILKRKLHTGTRVACLAAWIIGLILVAAVPALAAPRDSVDLLGHQLERVELEVMTWGDKAPSSEKRLQLLRHVRYLGHVGLKHGADPDIQRRIEDLESRIRAGRVRTRVDPEYRPKTVDKVGSIHGTVTRSADGSPLAGVEVQLRFDNFSHWTSATTNTAGQYTLQPPEPGNYYVTTSNNQGFLDELHDDAWCGPPGTSCGPADGASITVGSQGDIEVNFALDLGGSISGAVTSAKTGEPLDFQAIQLWNESGEDVHTDHTEIGQYYFQQLPPGSYFVVTQTSSSYGDELFDDVPCPGGFNCDLSAGRAIQIELGTVVSGIDFALEELGQISGRIVDAYSGNAIPFEHVWALDEQGSSVDYGISNADGYYLIGGLPSGTYYALTSPANWGFERELYDDIPCSAPGGCDLAAGTPIPVELNQTTPDIDFVLEGGCANSDIQMCLNRDRFQTEVTWRTASGDTGKGYAQELTDDSGYFWFFGEDNIELMVKVLDACTLAGANKFWVFAGGLTDVEVTLKITDTQTGEVRTYVNPLGTPFQPIQDTSAFDTCP